MLVTDASPRHADARRPDGGDAARAASGRALSHFFVRGHPRSGTNWVGRLLNLHPKVHCSGEWYLNAVVNTADDVTALGLGSKEPYRSLVRNGVRDIVRRCLTQACLDKPGVTHSGDRTPAALSPMLPDAKYLLVLRDGRDVLVSFTYLQLNGHGQIFRREPWATQMRPMLDRFAADPHCYVNNPQDLLADERWVRFAARHWAERVEADAAAAAALRAHGTEVHEVRYEALHADVEAEREAMYRFLGLDPREAAPLSRGKDTAPGLASEDPTAFRRKGEIGDWKRHFSPQVSEWFNDEAGAALRRLGYGHERNEL